MTYDPNIPRDPNLRPDRPELRTTPEAPRKASLTPWIAVIAVLLVGGFIWMQMGSPSSTDPTTTSSTTPPAATTTTPAPESMTPAAPPAATPAPATPNNGTTTQP